MIYKRLQAYIKERRLLSYSFLEAPLDKWTNKHFVALSKILLISESSVKRLFKYSGHKPPNNMNQLSREKIASFLGYIDWVSLEDELIRKASEEL